MHIQAARFLSLSLFPVIALSQPSTISGSVRDPSGNPVDGIVVLSADKFEQRTPTLPDSAFRFSNLPPGRYSICMVPSALSSTRPGGPFVDSCLWPDPSAPPISVVAGATANLVVRQGYLLKIRVNDPRSDLQRTKATDVLSVQARNPGGLTRPVPITRTDPYAREHSMVLPYEILHAITIASPAFILKDQSARDIDPATPLTQSVPRGQKVVEIVMNVDRPKP
jgi:hypothetical protein